MIESIKYNLDMIIDTTSSSYRQWLYHNVDERRYDNILELLTVAERYATYLQFKSLNVCDDTVELVRELWNEVHPSCFWGNHFEAPMLVNVLDRDDNKRTNYEFAYNLFNSMRIDNIDTVKLFAEPVLAELPNEFRNDELFDFNWEEELINGLECDPFTLEIYEPYIG